MMARDILAIQAAGVGIEREFSIAGSFNLDERSYSSRVLSALMIVNHYQSEENRDSKRGYYLELRVEEITPEEIEAEEDEDNMVIDAVLQNLAINYISDDNEYEDEGGDQDKDEEEHEEIIEPLARTRTRGTPVAGRELRRLPRRFY